MYETTLKKSWRFAGALVLCLVGLSLIACPDSARDEQSANPSADKDAARQDVDRWFGMHAPEVRARLAAIWCARPAPRRESDAGMQAIVTHWRVDTHVAMLQILVRCSESEAESQIATLGGTTSKELQVEAADLLVKRAASDTPGALYLLTSASKTLHAGNAGSPAFAHYLRYLAGPATTHGDYDVTMQRLCAVVPLLTDAPLEQPLASASCVVDFMPLRGDPSASDRARNAGLLDAWIAQLYDREQSMRQWYATNDKDVAQLDLFFAAKKESWQEVAPLAARLAPYAGARTKALTLSTLAALPKPESVVDHAVTLLERVNIPGGLRQLPYVLTTLADIGEEQRQSAIEHTLALAKTAIQRPETFRDRLRQNHETITCDVLPALEFFGALPTALDMDTLSIFLETATENLDGNTQTTQDSAPADMLPKTHPNIEGVMAALSLAPPAARADLARATLTTLENDAWLLGSKVTYSYEELLARILAVNAASARHEQIETIIKVLHRDHLVIEDASSLFAELTGARLALTPPPGPNDDARISWIMRLTTNNKLQTLVAALTFFSRHVAIASEIADSYNLSQNQAEFIWIHVMRELAGHTAKEELLNAIVRARACLNEGASQETVLQSLRSSSAI